MPNTERFVLKSVIAELKDRTHVAKLREVRARCATCQRDSTLTKDRGLIDVSGAGVLTCQHYGERQGVSRALFEEFLVRFPKGLRNAT